MPEPSSPRRVAVLAFPGVELLDVVGPLEAFAAASALHCKAGAPPAYAVEVMAARPGPVRAASGLAVLADRGLDEAGIDTLLVAGGAGIEAAAADPALVAWLRAAAPRLRRLGSVCTGAMLLAEAGLLDGRRAATHWNWCERLGRRYPAVRVEPDPIFIQDGPVWTSAGVTAGMDLALAMIEADHGRDLALTTDMCISTTARVAANLGYRTVVAGDACACFDLPDGAGGTVVAEDLHRAHLATLAAEFATVTTTGAVVEQLGA